MSKKQDLSMIGCPPNKRFLALDSIHLNEDQNKTKPCYKGIKTTDTDFLKLSMKKLYNMKERNYALRIKKYVDKYEKILN
jgi:hypothetical protein